jgi:hypothetical protein
LFYQELREALFQQFSLIHTYIKQSSYAISPLLPGQFDFSGGHTQIDTFSSLLLFVNDIFPLSLQSVIPLDP